MRWFAKYLYKLDFTTIPDSISAVKRHKRVTDTIRHGQDPTAYAVDNLNTILHMMLYYTRQCSDWLSKQHDSWLKFIFKLAYVNTR